MNFIELHIP